MPKSLKQLNCDFVQMIIGFDEKNFKTKDFRLDVKPKKRDETFFYYTYGSKLKSRKEHAHLYLSLSGKDSNLRITFNQGKNEDEDVREPYLEDFIKWISSFFIEKHLSTNIMAVYKYNQKYESLVQLNYPLLVGSGLYKGALVSGHEISFPDENPMSRAIISSDAKTITVILNAWIKFDLSEFDVHEVAEMVGKFANALVKKKEEDNVKTSERTNS